jgi:spore cortex protein
MFFGLVRAKENKGVFRLKNAMKIIGAISVLSVMTACANYADNDDRRYNDATRPIGYYSTERYADDFRYGQYGTNATNYDNSYILSRRGPAADFFDTDNNRARIPGITRFDTDTPALPLDADFSDADRNYHGHLNSMESKTTPSYYRKYDGRLAETISRRAAAVRGVNDARTLVYRDHVLVAISTNSKYADHVKRLVAQAVAPHTKGKHVRVVSNPSMYNRVRTIDNDIRRGRPMEEIERDLKTIFIDGKINERPANTR